MDAVTQTQRDYLALTDHPNLVRTPWALTDPLLLRYYDEEWGEAITEENALFERLTLECFQSGLSWLTILRKREAFRHAFLQFDVAAVAEFDDLTITELMRDAGIVRNRLKIRATVANAKAIIALREKGMSFSSVLWSFMPERSPVPAHEREIPTRSVESDALAQTLKTQGFCFVGPTNMYALMSAIGMVDTHLVTSHRRGCSGVWNIDGSRTGKMPLLDAS